VIRSLPSLILTVFCLLLSFHIAQAQSISGTVNSYAQVTNLTGNNVTVGSAAGFNAGDRVLLIQMKGATINTANTAAYGNLTNLNDAGNYELSTIDSVSGNVVTLMATPCQSYDPTGRVQLIRVYTDTNATVTGNLTCQPWNGTTGGVVVLEITDTLTLNADIDVTGDGFRGGAFVTGGFSCGDQNYISNSQGGSKGEGITDFVGGQTHSRGKQANGGGGSNRGNCGAGGGGNGGAGGLGGYVWSGCGNTTIQGVGGLSLPATNGKAFLGGGGGGGFRDNGQTVSSGSNGGGLIYILAGTVIGNGNVLRADADQVVTVTNDEGAGAAGAGGTILMDVGNYAGFGGILLSAIGGTGGYTFNNIFTGNCHGPGGGGGGGIVWLNQTATPVGVVANTNPGVAGIVSNPAQSCFNTTYGATDGTPGSLLFNLAPPAGAIVDLGSDTTLCTGDTLVLAPGAFTTYTWSDSSTADTLAISTAGQYAVTVTNGCGFAIDTIDVSIAPLPTPDLGNDTTVCSGTNVTFSPGTFAAYVWQDNTTNPTLVSGTTGQISVTVTDTNGCQAADTALLTVNPLPTVNITGNLSYCLFDSTQLDAGPGFTAYNWSNGATTQTIFASSPGPYSVTVTDANGCQNSDTVIVSVLALPVIGLGNDITVCEGTPVTLNASPLFSGYLWQDGSTNQTFSPTVTGTYSVTVTDANGCQDRDTIEVTFNPNPVVDLGPDQAVCIGQSATFTTGLPSSWSYVWQDGTTPQSYIASNAGNYAVTVTDPNGCSGSDNANLVVNPLPTPDLGPDFQLCAGNVQVSPSGGPYNLYQWQDGSTNPTFNVPGPGTYSVTVTDGNGCENSDDVLVTPGVATIDLGNDTTICDGDVITLQSGPGWVSVVWEDGSTGGLHTVGAIGTYSITVVDPLGCVATDDMDIVGLVPYPTPNLGADTVLCVGTTLTADAGPGDTYQWSTGATTQTIDIPASPGLYQVTVTVAPGCSSVDGILITQSLPLPQADLGTQQQFCAGDSPSFDVSNTFPATYLWSTGETTPDVTVYTSGTYSVSVTNVCGTAIDSVDILPVIFPPQPDLGPDTNMCNEILTLDAGVVAPNYLWGNGASTPIVSAFHPGTYFVTASNQCGSGSDTIVIVELCEPRLFFPNAFTPDGNGTNDDFGPVGEIVTEYSMSIYDRWGKLIFISNSQNDYWDGTISGQPVSEGAYVWVTSYSYTYRGVTRTIDQSGTVTLYR